MQYTTIKDLRIEERIYGMPDGKRAFRAVYRAPTLHFFARDPGTFEESRQSVTQYPSCRQGIPLPKQL